MKTMFKAAAIAATMLSPLMLDAAMAQAPAPAAASAPGYAAIADLGGAVRNSTAFRNAAQQVQTQYKTQIDAYNAKSAPYSQELQRMQQDIQTTQNQPNATDAQVQAKITAFQTREQAIRRELAPLAAPFERPLAYIEEQVTAKLDPAVRAAMAAKRVTMLVRPEALGFALPTANITGDITAQLNVLVKTVSITPPAGWQPGGAAAEAAGARGTQPVPQGR